MSSTRSSRRMSRLDLVEFLETTKSMSDPFLNSIRTSHSPVGVKVEPAFARATKLRVTEISSAIVIQDLLAYFGINCVLSGNRV